MEIQGPRFGLYDAGHISAVGQRGAQSIKPNVLRELEELDDEVKLALLLTTTDEVELSAEARAYLKQLRKRLQRRGKERDFAEASEQDFAALLEGLDAMRAEVEKDELESLPANPAFPPAIQLSSHRPDSPRPRPAGPAGTPTTRVRELLDGMIAHASSKEIREIVKRELEVFGESLVSMMKQFGVRIILLRRGVPLTALRVKGMNLVAPGERTFDGRPWETVRGIYDQSRRWIVLGEEMVGNPFRSVSRHEFAHAYDHAFTERNRRRLPLSVQLWNLFRGDRKGLVSGYAGTNPAEYFAESVEAYFQESQREKLRVNDPKMFSYLQELFRAA